MMEWLLQIAGPAVGGVVSGLILLGGIKAEVRLLNASVARAHERLDDHISRHPA